jgi:membrane fusion protein (multidrug efflux system)
MSAKSDSKPGRIRALTIRMFLMLAVAAIFIGTVGFVKFRQIKAAAAEHAAFQPPPQAVTTAVASQETWPATMSIIGTAAAVQGVTVSADLPGIVERITFESGGWVREGEVLVQLDIKQEQAQLAAAEADRDLARLNFERLDGLVNQGAISKADYDRSAAEQKSSEAKVAEIRATIARKTVRAPFTGILGIRQVNVGQYLKAGDPVVPLQSLNPIYVNFGVPQQDAAPIRVGRNVRVTGGDLSGGEFAGRVTAINSIVDETTRNVQIQATLANPNGKLRPGMFVQVEVGLGASQSVVVLPASAIGYAPYGNSVFVVTDLKGANSQSYLGVRQQFVKLGASRGDQVAVISGLNPGEEVVSSGIFKLRNGAAVTINNKIQPENKKAPNPEDN